ncbi:hypothetical protein PR048_004106 [Dryococelus australis]|uniref:Uncharacterized protein n=1 Tax=Dryococelus australis TaxID=614101 RepID=A0ABQ9I6H1_9NEOP|nr:hypothetical protein PR048_004106 [Dryococelus australis]
MPQKKLPLKIFLGNAACSARYKLTKLKTADPAKVNFQRIAESFSPTMILFNYDNLPGFSELPQTDICRWYREIKQLAELQMKKKEKMLKWKENYVLYLQRHQVCSRLLWAPSNNVDSERLLSHYNNVVTDRRTKLNK